MESRVIPPAQASARRTEMGDRFNLVLFKALDALQERRIPYGLIGGIAASGLGRPRSTHDIDIFVRPEDAEAALEALARSGFDTEKTDPRWLFKGWMEDQMVDIIFKSSGDIYFDDEMSRHAQLIEYHGRRIPAVAPEDLIIIKAAVHSEVGPHHWHDALAILSHATVNWEYLLRRARRAPRRLLALLVYAQSNDIFIPNTVIMDLYNILFGSSMIRRTQETMRPSPVPRSEEMPSSESENQKESSPTYLLGHIQESLATDPRTAALDVVMKIGGKKILVKGEASSQEARTAIEDVIRSQAKGYEVDNQVKVSVVTPPEAEEVV